MLARDKIDVVLRSSRAPYVRGGIEFGSNREDVVVAGDQITDEQLEKLADDAAISIALVNRETGERQEFAKLSAEPVAPPAETPPADTPPAVTPPVAPAPAPAPAVAPKPRRIKASAAPRASDA